MGLGWHRLPRGIAPTAGPLGQRQNFYKALTSY